MEDNTYTTTMETENTSPLPLPQITLESLGFLNTAAQWTKFLAIMGFIGIGIMLLAGLFMGVLFSVFNPTQAHTPFPFPMQFLGLIYFILAAVYVFPVIYLNNFSNYISKAVAIRETMFLTIAFKNIKKHFKFIGIAAIAMIGTYIVLIIAFVIYTAHSVQHVM